MKKYLKDKKSKEHFYSTPTSILSSKTFTDSQKLVIIVMMADLEMNGVVKWCMNTYADKTGTKRNFIVKLFKRMVKYNLLSEGKDNKSGSRYNTFTFNTHVFELLLKSNKPEAFGNSTRKPVSQKPKAVSQKPKAVSQEHATCISEAHNLYPRDTHIDSTDSIENTYLYREEEDDDVRTSSPSSRDQEDLEDFLKELEHETI